MEKERYLIAVGSWGVRDFIATEKEAEEWRIHKARWEGSPAMKITYKDFIKLTEEAIKKHWAWKMILIHQTLY